MKTIKIIDLLNRISRGEVVPKRIKYKNEIRDYVDDDKDYICRGSKNYYLFYDILKKGTGKEFKQALNDKVEIIEEDKQENMKIEKIDYDIEEDKFSTYINGRFEWVDIPEKDRALYDFYKNKINEIIAHINKEEN